MRRQLLRILLPALCAGAGVLLAHAGSGRSAAAPPARKAVRTGFPLTVTDDAGRKVTLKAPPRRIISLAPGHTETLYALGVGERVVLADSYSDYPSAVRPKAKLQCWPRPPVEQIVAARPDLVLVMTQEVDFLGQMDAARVPALKLFPRSYDAVLREIELLGRVLAVEAQAGKMVRRMRSRAAAVRRVLGGVRPKRTMYELDASDPARPYVAGGGGFYGEIVRMGGGQNIFADLKTPAAQASVEQVVARDPEVILLGDTRSPANPQQPGRVRSRPGWAGIAAVRTGRIFAVNSDRITRPGPRLVEGIEEVARLLHPERFK